MFMEDSFINFFETYDTTQSLWNALKEKYDKTTEINTQLLLQKYNSCKMQEEQSVVEHVNNMIVMAKDLSIAGTPIPEKLQVATILNSLPNSFDMVTTSMRSNPSLQLSELPARLGTEQYIMSSRRKQELNLEEANFVHRKLKNDKDHNRRNAPYKARHSSNPTNYSQTSHRGLAICVVVLATIEQIVQTRMKIKARHRNRKQTRESSLA